MNLLQEVIATTSDPSKMDKDYRSLQTVNEKKVYELEAIFDEVKVNRGKIGQLEKELQAVSDLYDVAQWKLLPFLQFSMQLNERNMIVLASL